MRQLVKTILFLCHKFINNFILPSFEYLYVSKHEKSDYPHIFIIGSPRSGSTLLFQVMTDVMDLGYLSNKHKWVYGAPFLVSKINRNFRKNNIKRNEFTSSFGNIEGIDAPSECGVWWYRFFASGSFDALRAGLSSSRKKKFIRSLNALSKAEKRPVIYKNLYASLRIQSIMEASPSSLFIIIKRNELDNAHSLLEARKLHGGYHQWFSIPTPAKENPEITHPVNQVLDQIRTVYQVIEDDLMLSSVDSERVAYVDYEGLCEHPNLIMKSMHGFLTGNGCDIPEPQLLNDKSFNERSEVRIDQDIYSELLKRAK